MKKNILGAFVIMFVAVALFLMIEDIAKSGTAQPTQNVEIYDENNHPDLATLDAED